MKNLIFDLGGVVLDLDVAATLKGFSALSGLDEATVTKRFVSSAGFLEFERGELSEQDFRKFVRELYNVEAPDEELDRCWNAMLVAFPIEKLHLLNNLRKHYKTFLLSNTNSIHLRCINEVIIPATDGMHTLDDYFDRTYYSHEMGTRKPEAAIFQQVLNENNLVAAETLFLDDNADNIAGAERVGLKTAFVNTPSFILDYFHEHRTA